jgi:hypothetical protein
MGKQRRQFNAGFKAKVALKAWTPTSDDFYLLRASRFYRKMGVHGFKKMSNEKAWTPTFFRNLVRESVDTH